MPEDPVLETRREEILVEAFSHREALLAYAWTLVRDWNAAEDVLQESVLVAMRRWEDVHDDSGILAWMRAIVRLKSFEALRERRRRGETLAGDEELWNAVADSMDAHFFDGPDTPADERFTEHKTALLSCMEGLTEEQEALVRGFYWEKRRCEDLALEWNRRVESVRTILHRVRKRLAECVEKRVKEDVA